jgi:hypothetical protein
MGMSEPNGLDLAEEREARSHTLKRDPIDRREAAAAAILRDPGMEGREGGVRLRRRAGERDVELQLLSNQQPSIRLVGGFYVVILRPFGCWVSPAAAAAGWLAGPAGAGSDRDGNLLQYHV